jgi:hypothetical protein
LFGLLGFRESALEVCSGLNVILGEAGQAGLGQKKERTVSRRLADLLSRERDLRRERL